MPEAGRKSHLRDSLTELRAPVLAPAYNGVGSKRHAVNAVNIVVCSKSRFFCSRICWGPDEATEKVARVHALEGPVAGHGGNSGGAPLEGHARWPLSLPCSTWQAPGGCRSWALHSCSCPHEGRRAGRSSRLGCGHTSWE